MFVCPNCKEQLNKFENSYRCKNNHSFDIARQGYVNLLPVNKKHSDNPGDSKNMVLARRAFLESGYYECFSDKLNELVEEASANSRKLSILDCGCGEGYYDGKLIEKLDKLKTNYKLLGFDISKEAVRFAAGKYKKADFFVGSCFNMPLTESFFDIAINIFAPMVESEFCRVLKKGGYLIYAVPGKNHLMGLKELLYENVYENEEKHTEYEGFKFVGRHSVKKQITVDGEMGVNLFKMTPYYFKTELSAEEKILKNNGFTTEIHFDFLVYRKI